MTESHLSQTRRRFLQGSAATGALLVYSPPAVFSAKSTSALSPNACPHFPFDITQDPVVFALGGSEFRWSVPTSPAPVVSGSFTFNHDGSLLHTGTIAVTGDEPGRGVSVELTLTEGGATTGQALSIQTVSRITDEPVGSKLSTSGTFQGHPFSFDYDLLSKELSNRVEDPSIPGTAAGFTLAPYQPFASLVSQTLGPTNAVMHEQTLQSCGTLVSSSNGWGFWSGLAACAAAGGISGWCLSAVVDGVGASCCSPAILSLAVVYLRCLETI